MVIIEVMTANTVLLLFGLTLAALNASAPDRPLCLGVDDAEVILVATPAGEQGPTPHTCPMLVNHVYKGVPPDVHSLLLETKSISCRMLGQGPRILMTSWTRRAPPTIDDGWDAPASTENIEFLDAYTRAESKSYIFGSVLLDRLPEEIGSLAWPGRDGRPVPKAHVTLKSGSLIKTTNVGSDGWFRFDDLALGRYTVTAEAPSFGISGSQTVLLQPGACAVAFPSYSSGPKRHSRPSTARSK